MVLNFIGIISIIWLVVLSVAFYKTTYHYKKLTKNSNTANVQTILEECIHRLENLEKNADNHKERISILEKNSQQHFQKLSVIRFNPFKDTGGNQSFAIAILNAKGDGMILSNLYARTGSRWYIKMIQAGKSTDLELSKEEEEAVNKALKV